MTVGELRAALLALPDDLKVTVIYEGGSDLGSPVRAVVGRSHYHPEGALFLDCDDDRASFDGTVKRA